MSTATLLRQLKDIAVVDHNVTRATLVPIDTAAVLLDRRGCKQVADQLRNADLQAFLAGERALRERLLLCAVILLHDNLHAVHSKVLLD